MIIDASKRIGMRVEIDLTGPEGNVFVLMGYVTRWARQLGLNAQKLIDDMRSSDYEHAIQVIEENFGDYVIMYK
jgi:hypothetical protein